MSFANINLGTTAGDHTGDPLRTAFDKINKNFWQITNGGAGVTVISPVNSVAGRTGNVTLTVSDIPGAITAGQVSAIIQSNLDAYANLTYVNTRVPNVSIINTMISDAINAENLQDIRDYTSSLQAQIYSNDSDIGALQTADTQLGQRITAGNAVVVTANTAMKSYVDAQVLASANNINGLWIANAAAQSQALAALTANAGIQGQAITNATALADGTVSNLALFVAPSLTAINVSIAGTSTAITSANTAMKGYVDAQIISANTALKNYTDAQIDSANAYVDARESAITDAWTANAAAQAGLISTQATSISTLASGQTAANAVIATKAPIASPTFTGNATAGNVFATGFFYANGVPFVSSSYNDSNVAAYLTTALPAYTGNIGADHISAGNITVTGVLHYSNVNYDNITISGNIIADNYLYAGTGPVNIRSNNDLNLQAAGRIYATSVEGIVSNANISTTAYFIGDGSRLTGVISTSNFGNTEVESWLRTGSNTIARINSNVTGSNTAIINLLNRVNSDAANTVSFVSGANAAIVTANLAMKDYVDSVRYTSDNVKEVLSTYTGNLTAGNISVVLSTISSTGGGRPLVLNFASTVATGVTKSEGRLTANAAIDATSHDNGALIIPNGGMGVAGNVYVAASPETRLQVGEGGQFLPNVKGQFTGNVDSYIQINMQNLNNGPYASSDFVATADNGNDAQNFIDMGIASTTYNFPGYSAIAPNDGYLIVNGGDLLINAGSEGKLINFAAGGSEFGNIVGSWSNVALTVNNNLSVLGQIAYTMGNVSNWDSTVTNVGAALDELAARLRAAGF
jgi:hypothetical protein